MAIGHRGILFTPRDITFPPSRRLLVSCPSRVHDLTDSVRDCTREADGEREGQLVPRHPVVPAHERQPRFPWRPNDDERVDALIPSWRLIVEGDGRRWHTRRRDFERDRHRDQQALAHGYRVLRFGWIDLHDSPDACLEIVLAAGGRPSHVGARLVSGWYVA